MIADLQAKLRDLNSLGWESPAGFDFALETRRVQRIKPEVEKIVGHRLSLDTSMQDASYFAELAWLDAKYYTPARGGALIPNIAVRFSTFDHMATVYSGNGDEKGLMRFEARIAGLLTMHGFSYIPEAVLRKPYPGKELTKGSGHLKGRTWEGWTWFTRFFDHL